MKKKTSILALGMCAVMAGFAASEIPSGSAKEIARVESSRNPANAVSTAVGRISKAIRAGARSASAGRRAIQQNALDRWQYMRGSSPFSARIITGFKLTSSTNENYLSMTVYRLSGIEPGVSHTRMGTIVADVTDAQKRMIRTATREYTEVMDNVHGIIARNRIRGGRWVAANYDLNGRFFTGHTLHVPLSNLSERDLQALLRAID